MADQPIDERGWLKLVALVDGVAHRIDDEGTLRTGEVALYRTTTGYAVQVRRRNGSAVECGRHGDLLAAIDAALTTGEATDA